MVGHEGPKTTVLVMKSQNNSGLFSAANQTNPEKKPAITLLQSFQADPRPLLILVRDGLSILLA